MANLETFAKAHRAQALREALLRVLSPGRRCALCGVRKRSHASLEVDHVHGRDWVLTSHSQLGRVRRYWREYRAGVALRALCRRCNARGVRGARW